MFAKSWQDDYAFLRIHRTYAPASYTFLTQQIQEHLLDNFLAKLFPYYTAIIEYIFFLLHYLQYITARNLSFQHAVQLQLQKWFRPIAPRPLQSASQF